MSIAATADPAAPASPASPASPATGGGAAVSDARLAADLRVATMRLRRRLVTERHPDNELSISAMAVLACLDREGEQTAAGLARHERVQPPTMTRTIKWMAEAGYVTKRPHPSDGRQLLVSLTDRGHEVVRADRRRRDAWLARRLAALSPHERDLLQQAAPILARLAQGD